MQLGIESSLLLFSGGMDSTCLLHIYKPKVALLINYGQKSFEGEKRAAKKLCKEFNVFLKIIESNISWQNNLIDKEEYDTWIPFRNQFLLTIAAIEASRHDISNIIIGTVNSDKKFGDGSKLFIKKINELFDTQELGIKVFAPAIEMNTNKLIQVSGIKKDLIYWCHSCDISKWACGICSSCKKYNEIIRELK